MELIVVRAKFELSLRDIRHFIQHALVPLVHFVDGVIEKLFELLAHGLNLLVESFLLQFGV